ncbi:MAG: DNA methyltransferase [Candidatus Methanospirareceae archaeon]
MMEIDGIKIKEVLEFPPAPAFGRFRDFFDRSSSAHPAKMHVELCADLIKRYTKPGDVVLDPMNGAGTTTILCMLLGRNAIGVELEEKFHNWCESSRKITEEKIKEFLGALKKIPPITGWCECNPPIDTYEPKKDVKNPDEVIKKFPIKIETCKKCGRAIYPRFGRVIHICGDARRLSELLKEHEGEISHILFSPPFANAKHHYKHGLKELGDNFKGRKAWEERKEEKTSEENIENLPFKEEEIGVIITSPPYSGSQVWISEQLRKDLFKGRRIFAETNDPRPKSEGQIANLPHGDIDSIIFSPPYSLGHDSGDNASEEYKWRLEEQRKHTRAYSEENNIAKLPHGKIDHIIFSPPFAGTSGGKGEKSRKPINERYPGLFERCIGGNKGALSDNPAQIDNLPMGNIDALMFSPPYPPKDDRVKMPTLPEERDKERGFQPYKGFRGYYSDNVREGNSENIGDPRKYGDISLILTSPPYESSLEGSSRHTRGGIASRDKKLAQTGSLTVLSEDTKKGVPIQYSPNPMNIGNLKSTNEEYQALTETEKEPRKQKERPTYLSEMLKVYKNCFEVLKKGGRMIVVVKDFIRNFKVIKLHEHTIKLCELAGFTFKEALLFKLPQKSFWRILYKKKYGDKVKDLHLLDYEWVLVFEK